jgi:hypothetical protein
LSFKSKICDDDNNNIVKIKRLLSKL